MKPFDARKILWSHLSLKRNSSHGDRSVLGFLRKIPLFEGLSRWQLKQVSELLYSRSYEPGEYLFEAGQPGAALFLIQTGRVSVEVDEGTQQVVFAELEPGSFIGELALLDKSPRSASARAVESTQALALLRSDLEDLIQKEPEITTHIYKALAMVVGERLKATNELVKKDKAAS